VVKLVDRIVPLYPDLNRDLLVAGALLHDAGKVREMAYQRAFDYTDEGKLLGHITIGVEMIQERLLGLPGFPPELAMLLKHMVLSHHGQYEFGSPKRPKTLEATVLNFLDDLDAKINGVRSHIARETPLNSSWTSYHRLYDRYFYSERYAGEEGPPIEEAPVEEAPTPPPVKTLREERPRGGFSNNPFDQLKDENLKLF
jgi:3'-5' exoribonuclease